MKLPATITVNMNDLERGLGRHTFEIRYSRPLRFRLWLAVKLTRVVAWLACADVDIGPKA